MAAVGERDLHLIEFGTAFLVLLILLIVYRNVITMLLPLITIVISLCTAQGVLAGLAEMGLRISPQTLILMSVVMIGAGVDYAVFLISRYHDYVRQGMDSKEAVKRALTSIGKVIAASAATVAVTFVAMIFRETAGVHNGGPGDLPLDRCGIRCRGDASSRHHRARRTTWLDQAETRSHQSVLASFGDTHRASPGASFGRQSDTAHLPCLLCELGAL